MAGYQNLEVYKLSFELSLRVHKVSLGLPKHEMYEEGSQIRRSAKSVCANIVEGFALRKYKNEYLHYLYRAYGSSEETTFHLEELFHSGSMTDQQSFTELRNSYQQLGGKLFKLIQSIEKNYDTPHFLKEEIANYNAGPVIRNQKL